MPEPAANALKAAGYIASLLAAVVICAAVWAWTMNWWGPAIYSARFSFFPVQTFGEKIGSMSHREQETCLIIGVSNSREGFDPAAMQAIAAGTKFVNAATTGGNIEVLEVQTAILRRLNVRPRCIIAGLSMWMPFREGSPHLINDGYIGLLNWPQVLGLTYRPIFSRDGSRIALALAIPLKAQARQLNRIIRTETYRLRGMVLGALPQSQYELFPQELKPSHDYLYFGMEPWLDAKRDEIIKQREPFYKASRYGDPQQDKSFRRALDSMLELTPRVVLVHMPTTYILDPASKWGEPQVRRVVNDYAGRVQAINCSSMRDESLFVDEGHLNERGRQILSKEVASLLEAMAAGSPAGATPHCVPGSL